MGRSRKARATVAMTAVQTAKRSCKKKKKVQTAKRSYKCKESAKCHLGQFSYVSLEIVTFAF